MRKRKLPGSLTCLLCGASKPSTREHWYLEENEIARFVNSACKVCVESRIAAQVPEIQRQVEAGTRRKAHHEDSFRRDHNAKAKPSKEKPPRVDS